MEEQNKIINEAVEELKGADEAKLKEVIEKWFESTRNEGMKIGAQFISAATMGIIQKHLNKHGKPSLRDYQRMKDDIIKLISIQLQQEETQQNDLEDENEGTTSENN